MTPLAECFHETVQQPSDEGAQKFINLLDDLTGRLVENEISLQQFFAPAVEMKEKAEGFYYRDHQNLPVLFFYTWNEYLNTWDAFSRISENNTFLEKTFEQLDEDEGEMLLYIDILLTAILRTDEYIADTAERELEIIDWEIVLALKDDRLCARMLEESADAPHPHFRDWEVLARLAYPPGEEYLQTVFYGGQYEMKAEMAALAMLICFYGRQSETLLAQKSPYWESYDNINDVYLKDLLPRLDGAGTYSDAEETLTALAASSQEAWQFFALLFCQFKDWSLPFEKRAFLLSCLKSEAVEDSYTSVHFDEESFYLAERAAGWFLNFNGQVLDSYRSDDNLLNFLLECLDLRESVFNRIISLFVLALEGEEGEPLRKALVSMIQNRPAEDDFAAFMRGNITILASLCGWTLNGASFAEFSIEI